MLNTWDIFDTLIARRCISPINVFKIMEQATQMTGLTDARIAAESNLINRGENYTLDDIYNELNNISELTKSSCQILKEIECQVEIEQAIPITENILKVKSGDILISDMYLPEEIIRKMLEKCGLIVSVEIVITFAGKSSGRVWRQLVEQNQSVFHIGDNEISDVKKAREFGLDSHLTLLNQTTDIENYFLDKDFEFAAYLREIRLKNPYHEEIKRQYWQAFTMNIGILIILVQLIDELQKNCGFEYLGFCGRDTYYLWHLYKKFKEDKNEKPPASDYLHYSRRLVHTSKAEMGEYFATKIKNRKALMIDLCGTGAHLHILRTDCQLNYSILLCYLVDPRIALEKYKDARIPKEYLSIKSTVKENFVYSGGDFYFDLQKNSWDARVEILNRATHNTPIKLQNIKIDGKIIPKIIFSGANDTEYLELLENALQCVLGSKIIWGGGENLNDKLENLKNMLSIFSESSKGLAYNTEQLVSNFIDKKYSFFKPEES